MKNIKYIIYFAFFICGIGIIVFVVYNILNLKNIDVINENFNLNLPKYNNSIIIYSTGFQDFDIFEKNFYSDEMDSEKIMNTLNNHDKNVLNHKLGIIYRALSEDNKKKYDEDFDYDYLNQEEVNFYYKSEVDRESILIFDKDNKVLYYLSSALR